MKQIYHPYTVWEDWREGFYNNCSGKVKQEKISKVLEMFNDIDKTALNMRKAMEKWKYSFEHNLTKPNLNQIAYIGQAACCIYGEVPSTVTMEAWNLLDKEVQERANYQASEILEIWLKQNDYA